MITQREVCKGLGLKKSWVCQLVKKGMPLTSLADAEKWYYEFEGKPKAKTNLPVSSDQPTTLVSDKEMSHITGHQEFDEAGKRLLAQLKRCEHQEGMAYNSMMAAYKAGHTHLFKALTSNHHNAVKQNLDVRAEYARYLQSINSLVDAEQINLQVRRVMLDILGRLQDMPQYCGYQCNPSDPKLAIQTLTDWRNSLIQFIYAGPQSTNVPKSSKQ